MCTGLKMRVFESIRHFVIDNQCESIQTRVVHLRVVLLFLLVTFNGRYDKRNKVTIIQSLLATTQQFIETGSCYR